MRRIADLLGMTTIPRPPARRIPARALQSAGFTMTELALVLVILGVLTTLTLPYTAGLIDRSRVASARAEAVATFALARHLAILRSRRIAVALDEHRGAMLVHIDDDTLRVRPLAQSYGVMLDASRDSLAYLPTGIGYGAANLRLVIARGRARDTIYVSRVGRVRH